MTRIAIYNPYNSTECCNVLSHLSIAHVDDIVALPNGLIAARDSSQICVYDLESKLVKDFLVDGEFALRPLREGTRNLGTMAALSSGEVAVIPTKSKRSVDIYNPITGKMIQSISNPGSKPLFITVNEKNGDWVVFCRETREEKPAGVLRIFNSDKKELRQISIPLIDFPTCLNILKDGRIIIGCRQNVFFVEFNGKITEKGKFISKDPDFYIKSIIPLERNYYLVRITTSAKDRVSIFQADDNLAKQIECDIWASDASLKLFCENGLGALLDKDSKSSPSPGDAKALSL